MINSSKKINVKEHWNTAYIKNSTTKLGWYEENSIPTLKLIKETNLPKTATILNIGAGSSTIIDSLLAQGYSNLLANDISKEALQLLKNRLGENASKVCFLEDDLTKPTILSSLKGVDLWNDRAVLHFFLTEDEQEAYFNLLKEVLNPNGYVIIAVFTINGAEKCSGLKLQRYNTLMLQEKLGEEFKLLQSFNYTFVNPHGGERPYIYTLFQRKN